VFRTAKARPTPVPRHRNTTAGRYERSIAGGAGFYHHL
jgi:hypothetical protein